LFTFEGSTPLRLYAMTLRSAVSLGIWALARRFLRSRWANIRCGV